MLIPNVNIKKFEEFGFRLCKGEAGRESCYYLCIAKGSKIFFVSPKCFDIQDWGKDDPRIHSKPNCRYKDTREVIDVIYDLIKADILKKEVSK